ncbi:MAG: STAS domain-containing protein [Planctomycetota bacterium]
MFNKLRKFMGGDDQPQPAPKARTASGVPASQLPESPMLSEPQIRPELASFDLIDDALVTTVAIDRLWGTDAADLVETILHELEKRGEGSHVIIDLQNVEAMDSSSLGMMVFLNNRLNILGGRVAVVNASCGLEDMFRLTQLDRMLPICRDVMKAVSIVSRRSAA